jgi:hypothetical protein
MILLLAGCRFEAVEHNPNKAISDAHLFLKALYVDEDYQKAFNFAHAELQQTAKPDDLRKVVARIKSQYGNLERLKADSYMQTPGSTMELFYVGTYDKGTLYHRVVLMGNVSSGYKVSGVWFKAEPYPEHTLRHKFNVDIYVE